MNRTPFQGVATVVRFNWHFYALALTGVMIIFLAGCFAPPGLAWLCQLLAALVVLSIIISLVTTWLAYDASGLYRLDWLAPWLPPQGTAANIHAGFDETSGLLRARFPGIDWRIYDFYDSRNHTEISIRRARNAHPPAPGTLAISTSALPLADTSLDRVVLLLSAHEIRDSTERIIFFRELKRVLATDGLIIVAEHLRDAQNIAAYGWGAWHFHRPCAWRAAFAATGFTVISTFKPAPLISTFVLRKHGSTD